MPKPHRLSPRLKLLLDDAVYTAVAVATGTEASQRHGGNSLIARIWAGYGTHG